MIKATAKAGDGRYVIVLGVSADNVDRLKDGKPIYFDLQQLQFPAGAKVGHLTLFYAATDAGLMATVKGLIGPETQFIKDVVGAVKEAGDERARAEEAKADVERLQAELAHEQHEKETVADAGQAMNRWHIKQREAVKEQITALRERWAKQDHAEYGGVYADELTAILATLSLSTAVPRA